MIPISSYFTPPVKPKDGDTIYAKDVNDINDAAKVGFDLVEADVASLSVDIDAKVEEARKWAEEDHLVEVEPGMYSAKSHSIDTTADAVATAADKIATNADVVSTNADAASTAQDAIDTAADLVSTNQDTLDTAADAVATGLDADKAHDWAEEAEDVEVETGEYSSHHWANKAEESAASIGTPIQGVTSTTPVTVDNTDPLNPIIGSTAGQVDTVVGTSDEIVVDATDPQNPILSISPTFSSGSQLPKVSDLITGNIQGLEYSYNNATAINITKGICYDSLNTTILTLSADTTATITSPVLNTIYNVFLTDAGDIQFDTDVDGATLLAGAVSQLRWIGFVVTNSSGDISRFIYSVDEMLFTKPLEWVFVSNPIPTTFTQYTLDAFIPPSRTGISVIAPLDTNTETPTIVTSDDGITPLGYAFNNATYAVHYGRANFVSGQYLKAKDATYNDGKVGLVSTTLKR